MGAPCFVCAIDVNDYDQSVIDLAAKFAHHYGARLDVLHVSIGSDLSKESLPSMFGTSAELINDHQKLREVSTNIDGVEVEYHHLSGSPAQKILEYANEATPDLVVLGTHGRTGLGRLFGSVAETVMRDANCPVLILRRQDHPVQQTNPVRSLDQDRK